MSGNTYLTYNQWEKLHKVQIRKWVEKKTRNFLYWASVGVVLYFIPIGMIFHWIVKGY